jgi:hypothetical protein
VSMDIDANEFALGSIIGVWVSALDSALDFGRLNVSKVELVNCPPRRSPTVTASVAPLTP